MGDVEFAFSFKNGGDLRIKKISQQKWGWFVIGPAQSFVFM